MAQYYMNIGHTDGTKQRYPISIVDSVWFDTENLPSEPSGTYEYVDLGLSVKWATFNVGATAPEEYGDYYAWGEIEPYYEEGEAQSNEPKWKSGMSDGYTWSSYKYCNGDYGQLIKYCIYSSVGYEGFRDGKTVLEPEDDVAHVKWGGSWRMPTIDEISELRNKCVWEWTTSNGVEGYKVTSGKAGYTDRSIFLPAAGFRGNTNLYPVNGYGCYWSNSLYPERPCTAEYLYFECGQNPGFPGWHEIYFREYYLGNSVRPVCP